MSETAAVVRSSPDRKADRRRCEVRREIAHVSHSGKEHPAGAEGGVVDRLAFLWVNGHDMRRTAARRVELARFLLVESANLLMRLFVCVAHPHTAGDACGSRC